MSESDTLVADMAERLFGEIATTEAAARHDRGEWPAEAWRRVDEMGFPLALVPEEAGGLGLDAVEALGLVRVAGRHALPLPLAETMGANRLLAEAGLPLADGVASFADTALTETLRLERSRDGWHLAGEARRVPWARHASSVVVIAAAEEGAFVVAVPVAHVEIRPGANLANEPRDDLRIELSLRPEQVAPRPGSWAPDQPRRLGAALRSVAIAGALGRVLELTVAYAGERVQFGRPLGRFQAIQQNLAAAAGHVAAAGSAADGAAEAVAAGGDLLPIAAAKVRTGEAAGAAAAIAHQVHGAMGYTREHALNHLTRRLLSWRAEFGDEAAWSRAIGRAALDRGADGLWPLVTAAA